MPATSEKKSVEDREGYIGGSDAGALLGLSPWSSPMQVFADKRGLGLRQNHGKTTLQKFYFGKLLEDAIGKAVAHFHGIPVVREKKFWRAPGTRSFMGGHLDWMLKNERAFLECKNIQYMSDEWGQPHDSLELDASAIVPKYYLAQCDHYLYVTDFDYCYLAALVGGCDLKMYRIYRDAGREAQLLAAEDDMWDRVQHDEPPMGRDYDDFCLALRLGYVKGLNSKDAKKLDPIFLTESQLKALREIEEARATANVKYKTAKALSAALVESLGYKFGYLCDTHGEPVGSILSQSRSGFDDFALKMERPKLYEKYATKTTFPVIRVRNARDDEEANA